MTHKQGENDDAVHKLAWDTFVAGTEVAKKLKLYGAGQDLLADAFSGNVKGMGPGFAEMEIEERPSEPIIVFMADKTSAGAWNLPAVQDVRRPVQHDRPGHRRAAARRLHFEVHDVQEHRRSRFNAPKRSTTCWSSSARRPATSSSASSTSMSGEIAAVSTTDKLSLIAGRYVGKDDPA